MPDHEVIKTVIFILFSGVLYILGYVHGKIVGKDSYERKLLKHLDELRGLNGVRVIKDIEHAIKRGEYNK